MKDLSIAIPSVAAGTVVRIQNLCRAYGDKVVLDGLNMEIAAGEIIAWGQPAAAKRPCSKSW